jgi:putative ABC transport system ATP-binding protein
LDGVDFEAKSSEVTVIAGTNGSGKSTLLNAISGVLDLDEGDILFDNVPLHCMNVVRISRLRGILQQMPLSSLCPTFTVEEMLRLYVDGIPFNRAKAEETFRRTGIGLNARISDMSGGQQQLIALELVLIREPRVLLLDEPTASLDPRHASRILERVVEVAANGVTVILVTHNLDQGLSVSQRIYLMHGGRVVTSWEGVSLRNLTANNLKMELVRAAAHSIGAP